MTVSANVLKLEDGPRNAVFHLYGTVGGGDEEYNVLKIQGSALSPLPHTLQAVTHMALERIEGHAVNLTVKLDWQGSSTNGRLWVLPANQPVKHNFRHTSPLQDQSTGRLGNVLLTTEAIYNFMGSSAPPDAVPLDGYYDIMLWLRKKYE
jgi:hypothetical protein